MGCNLSILDLQQQQQKLGGCCWQRRKEEQRAFGTSLLGTLESTESNSWRGDVRRPYTIYGYRQPTSLGGKNLETWLAASDQLMKRKDLEQSQHNSGVRRPFFLKDLARKKRQKRVQYYSMCYVGGGWQLGNLAQMR